MLPSGSATPSHSHKSQSLKSQPLKRKHLGPQETDNPAQLSATQSAAGTISTPSRSAVAVRRFCFSDYRDMVANSCRSIVKPANDTAEALKKMCSAISQFPPFFRATPQWTDRTLAKKLLAFNGGLLKYLHPEFRSDPELVELALQKTLSAYRYASPKFMYDIRNVLKYKNFSVLPRLVHSIEKLSKPELLNALPQLPCEIACRVFASGVKRLWPQHSNGHDLKKSLLELSGVVHQSLRNAPYPERLRITSVFLPIVVDTVKPEHPATLAQDFYPDHRSLLISGSPRRYLSGMSHWFKANGVSVFDASVLFDPDRVREVFTNQNAIVFLDSQDMRNHGSGLNGLLESGTWHLQGVKGKVVARIVLVLEDKKLLSKDIVNRLAAHIDGCLLFSSYMRDLPGHDGSHPLLPHSARAADTEQLQWGSRHVVELFDRQALLHKRFITPEHLFQGGNRNKKSMPEVLVQDIDEAWSVKDSVPPETNFVMPAPVVLSDFQGETVQRLLSQEMEKNPALFLVEGASEVDQMIDHYLKSLADKDRTTIAQQLAQTHVYINSMTANNLYASVFESNQTPYMVYREQAYPVAGISRSDFSPAPDGIRSKAFEPLSAPQTIAYIKENYQKGKYCTQTRAGELLFNAITQLMMSRDSVLLIEGASGIGKDAVSGQLLEELQSSFSDALKYHHVTAAYDISLVDEMLELRKQFPDHTLMVHISEANLSSKKAWANILLFMKTDGNIKVLASQNPANFGGRFALSGGWPKVSVPDYSSREMVGIIIHMLRELGLKNVSVSDLKKNALAIEAMHRYLQGNTKEGVTLRQLHHFLALLLEDREDVSPKTLHSKLYRAYGSSLDDAVDKFRVNETSLSLVPFKKYATKNKVSRSLAMKIQSPHGYDYSSAPAPTLPWKGQHTSYLSDQVDSVELSPPTDFLKHYHVTKTCDKTLAPGTVIGLLSYPGQGVAVVPRNESGNKLKLGAIGVEKQLGRWVIRNKRHFPIKIELKFKHEPTFYSRTHPLRIRTLNQTPQKLTEQQEKLVSTLCHHVSKVPVTTRAEQQSVLANYFGISPKPEGGYDTAEVVSKLFRFFCRYADGPNTHKPEIAGLDRPSTQLLHSLLSQRGVCKHQSAWLEALLKCFDLAATQHGNERHAFVVLDKALILNVDYFSNPMLKEHYHLLEKHVDGHDLLDPKNRTAEISAALKEAKALLRSDRVSHIQLSDLLRLNTVLRLSEEPDENPDQILSTNCVPDARGTDPNQRAAAQEAVQPPPLTTTPHTLLHDLKAGKLKTDDIPRLLQSPGAATVQQWLSVCSLSADDKREQDPPAAKRNKTHMYPMADEADRMDALKSIFMYLIAQVPSGSVLIRKFLPASQFKPHQLPLRAKRVPGGWLARYEKPSVDYTISVRLNPPNLFNEPYWLLQSQGKAEKIDSLEKHNAADRSKLYEVSSRDAQLFEQVFNNLKQQQ